MTRTPDPRLAPRSVAWALAVFLFLAWFGIICDWWPMAIVGAALSLALLAAGVWLEDNAPLFMDDHPWDEGVTWRRWKVTKSVQQHDGQWIIWGRRQW